MGVSQNRGKTPKMDGENNGKPYVLMDDLGGKTHYFRKHPYKHSNIFFTTSFFHTTRTDIRSICRKLLVLAVFRGFLCLRKIDPNLFQL